jgi:small subunit ribosomal protein S6
MPDTQSPVRVREYETIYILKPDVARDAQEKIAGRLSEVLTRENGKLTLVENWGRRQLAYPVAKCRRGLYVYLKYLGGGGLVAEVERNLRMLDDVIKYQTVQTNAEVELATIAINPDDVKFEGVELPAEEEPEDSIERRLGLIEGERLQRDDEVPDVDDDDYQVPDLNDIPGTEN